MAATDIDTLPSPAGTLAGAFVALLGGALAMAISPIFVRLADVGPYTSAFWRVGLALPILWAWMRLAERGGAPGRAFSKATIAAGLCFAGDLFFWHVSIVQTTVANATFFATTAPIWVVLFGWLFWRATVSRAVLAGLALCLLGGTALVVQSLQVGSVRVAGDGCGIATAVFFGLYFLAVTAARRDAGAARVTFELSLIAAAILLVVALVMEHRLWPASLRGWGALLGMSWISHAGGQGLLSIALGRLPPVFSSLVIFLESIAAAGFAWLILGEPVTLVQAIGGLVIVLGIWTARPRAPAP
jgi:drug/metabolite transporter (DMT)-like permease